MVVHRLSDNYQSLLPNLSSQLDYLLYQNKTNGVKQSQEEKTLPANGSGPGRYCFYIFLFMAYT